MMFLGARALPFRLFGRLVRHRGQLKELGFGHRRRRDLGVGIGLRGKEVVVSSNSSERTDRCRERRLAAQPLGNQRVRIGLAQQHERPPEPLDVRSLPRLAGDEILGDEARFRAAPAAMYASASCACALYIVASSPPSTQISTRRISAGDVIGHARDEFLQRGRGRRPVACATAASAASSTTWKPASGACSATLQPSSAISSRRAGSSSSSRPTIATPSSLSAPRELDLGDGQQQRRIVAGGFERQVFRRRGDVARATNARASCALSSVSDGIGRARLPQRLERLVGLALPSSAAAIA